MNTPLSPADLRARKAAGEPLVALTCYDAAFARVLDRAGVDILLVGDSLGMVLQGRETTLPVDLEAMVYHTACVARGRRRALVLADLPFLSYTTPERALHSAGRLLQAGGAQMVKLEGGAARLDTVRRLGAEGIPVCAHLGLLPQSVLRHGYHVHGREPAEAECILQDAVAMQKAGAQMLVLECVPEVLAAEIAQALEIPVIGIGAGSRCDGQVLVLYDLLGLTPLEGEPPRFVRDFLTGQDGGIAGAVRAYAEAVRARAWPSPDHGYA